MEKHYFCQGQMPGIVIQTHAACQFGSAQGLTPRQLAALAAIFTRPENAAPAVLSGRGAVTFGRLDGFGPVAVKPYARGGLIRHLVRRRYLRLGKTRGQREFELLRRAERLGINVPQPVAFAFRGRLLYTAWLVTAQIPGSLACTRLAAENPTGLENVIRSAADQIRVLIQNRILHVDLHPGNVVMDRQGRVFLLDFDKCRRWNGTENRLRRRYLARWQRAVKKHHLPQILNRLMYSALEKENKVGDNRSRRRLTDSTRTAVAAPSILIILMGSLGDIARALALVQPIKAHLPASRITWLVEPQWAELVGYHPQIDRIIIFRRAWRISAVWKLYRQLAGTDFDIALDLQRHLKSGFFSLLSGARRRVGFHRKNSREFNWLFNNEPIEVCSNTLSKLDHFFKFTAHLGIPDPEHPEFGFAALDAKTIAPPAVTGLNAPVVAVVMGSSWPSKDWHSDGYARLVQAILETAKLGVVLLGDRSQEQSARWLTARFDTPALVNLVGRTSLLELAAVLKIAVSGVGPDSGPGHLAAALGTPFITLFGPTSPARTAPFGCEQLVVRSTVTCCPCYKKKCPNGDNQCMDGISPEAVLQKLSQALSRAGMEGVL